ncbi:hypothetical protein L1987_79718 [Smallanthus sonchifolius]|uniref:Uncharacterized protein n=1 Tax=Smallanthus sonchifolius TaxID=185202 RepID=A0ACB8YL83_9ASTR|nr:hypothetical protein L1987_79718 [Smallanthus sonchifolius]
MSFIKIQGVKMKIYGRFEDVSFTNEIKRSKWLVSQTPNSPPFWGLVVSSPTRFLQISQNSFSDQEFSWINY